MTLAGLASLRERQGDEEAAISECTRAIDICNALNDNQKPENDVALEEAKALRKRAGIEIALSDYGSAEADLQNSLKLLTYNIKRAPRDVLSLFYKAEALFSYATLYGVKNQFDSAKSFYKLTGEATAKLLALTPKDGAALLLMSNSENSQGGRDWAESKTDQALQHYDAAIDWARKAAQTRPDDEDCYAYESCPQNNIGRLQESFSNNDVAKKVKKNNIRPPTPTTKRP
ncbi:MAG: hypothetical protein KGS72_12645 [Cyanobacteria bacterium REEB67]|nr:hypothetical protein [Cyanobacteria bacterium REEB67]